MLIVWNYTEFLGETKFIVCYYPLLTSGLRNQTDMKTIVTVTASSVVINGLDTGMVYRVEVLPRADMGGVSIYGNNVSIQVQLKSSEDGINLGKLIVWL